MSKVFTIRLLWHERNRVWKWYWYFRNTKPGYLLGRSYIIQAIRATLNNPPVADRWLRDEYPTPINNNTKGLEK